MPHPSCVLYAPGAELVLGEAKNILPSPDKNISAPNEKNLETHM